MEANFHGPIYQHGIDLPFWAVQTNFHVYQRIVAQQRAWVSATQQPGEVRISTKGFVADGSSSEYKIEVEDEAEAYERKELV